MRHHFSHVHHQQTKKQEKQKNRKIHHRDGQDKGRMSRACIRVHTLLAHMYSRSRKAHTMYRHGTDKDIGKDIERNIDKDIESIITWIDGFTTALITQHLVYHDDLGWPIAFTLGKAFSSLLCRSLTYLCL